MKSKECAKNEPLRQLFDQTLLDFRKYTAIRLHVVPFRCRCTLQTQMPSCPRSPRTRTTLHVQGVLRNEHRIHRMRVQGRFESLAMFWGLKSLQALFCNLKGTGAPPLRKERKGKRLCEKITRTKCKKISHVFVVYSMSTWVNICRRQHCLVRPSLSNVSPSMLFFAPSV